MDEHIGVTAKVAAAILSKPTLTHLLQSSDTQLGTAQRLQNILALFPTLLQTSAHQKRVFEVAETLMRIIAKWPHDDWSLLQKIDSSESGRSKAYLVILMHQILSLRASFTPKQTQKLDAWGQTIAAQGIDFDSLIATLRAEFLQYDPFSSMQIASFRIPGVKQADLHAKKPPGTKQGSTVDAASSPASNPFSDETPPAAGSSCLSNSCGEDIPFAFLPRTPCSSCGRSQPFYCTYCYVVIHEKAKGKLPQVHLPLSIDILLHPNVRRHKSTALQTLLLGEPRSQVQEHTFPAVPVYDPNTTAVVFPSKSSLTVAELASHMAAPNSQQEETSEASSVPTSLQRVVFLEGTWSEAETMLQHPNLRHLTHLRLDFSASPSETHSAEASSSSSSAAPTTAFWRYQKFGPGFLSSIEAIYHLFQQYEPHRAQLSNNTPVVAASSAVDGQHQYDNLLWLFVMAYDRVRTYYRSHSKLLPPPLSGGAIDG